MRAVPSEFWALTKSTENGGSFKEKTPTRKTKLDFRDPSIERLAKGVSKRLDAAEKVVLKKKSIFRKLAFMNMNKEANRILRRINAAEIQDNALRSCNRRATIQEAFLVISGISCSIFPGLLLFNGFLSMLSKDYEYTLGLAAQEYTYLGSASRFCLKVVDLAQRLSKIHQESGLYMSLCVVMITSVLLAMRFTVKRVVVRSERHREALRMISTFIREDVARRQRKLCNAEEKGSE